MELRVRSHITLLNHYFLESSDGGPFACDIKATTGLPNLCFLPPPNPNPPLTHCLPLRSRLWSLSKAHIRSRQNSSLRGGCCDSGFLQAVSPCQLVQSRDECLGCNNFWNLPILTLEQYQLLINALFSVVEEVFIVSGYISSIYNLLQGCKVDYELYLNFHEFT